MLAGHQAHRRGLAQPCRGLVEELKSPLQDRMDVLARSPASQLRGTCAAERAWSSVAQCSTAVTQPCRRQLGAPTFVGQQRFAACSATGDSTTRPSVLWQEFVVTDDDLAWDKAWMKSWAPPRHRPEIMVCSLCSCLQGIRICTHRGLGCCVNAFAAKKLLPKQSYSDCSERSAEKMTQMQRCGKSSISSISSRRPAVGMSSLQESNFPC